jgi:succinate dehydrogenase / fumarate reductase, membrane anchor subunit
MSMRSSIGRVRGLGSAKSGTHHWWMQRVTAIAMALLGVWLLASLVRGVAADHATLTAWIGNPVVAVLLILFCVTMFYHIRLGLQVLIEDYLHGEGGKLAALVALSFGCIASAVACIFSILKIAFGN